MNTSMSVIISALERVRAMLDESDQSGKYTNDFILRHILMPSLTDVWSRLTASSTSRVVVKHAIPIHAEQKRYPLPACVSQVLRLTAEDSDGRVLSDWKPRHLLSDSGPGWRLEGAGDSMSLLWDPSTPGGYSTVKVWYVPNGDLMLHYSTGGGAASQISFTGASWNQSTRTLTKVGAFASYEFQQGDRITLTAVTGGTPVIDNIESRTSDDAIVLEEGPGSGSSNISGRLWSRRLTLAASPTLGSIDRRENGYLGGMVRVLHASPLPIYSRQIVSQEVTPSGAWTVVTDLPFDGGGSPNAVPYEVVQAGSQEFVQVLAMRAALHLSVMRRWPESQRRALQVEYLSAMKTAGDRLSYVEGRVGKSFPSETVDRPTYGTLQATPGVIDTDI